MTTIGSNTAAHFFDTSFTTNGPLYSDASGVITSGAAGSAGQIYQSAGAGSAPSYSTATFPSTATGTGKVLVADGTNWVASTPTFPNASATSGKIIQSDGTNWLASTPTYPTTAGTAGKIYISDGTNIVSSTPTYPNSASGTGTILRANGTNWVATTSTYPNTNAVSTLLYASSANVMTELPTANNGILSTNSSGVPSIVAVNTYVPTCVGGSTAGSTTYTVQQGRYIQIGPFIICQFVVIGTFGGTAAGAMTVSLPVTSATVTNIGNWGSGLAITNSVGITGGGWQVISNQNKTTYLNQLGVAALVSASNSFNCQGTVIYFTA